MLDLNPNTANTSQLLDYERIVPDIIPDDLTKLYDLQVAEAVKNIVLLKLQMLSFKPSNIRDTKQCVLEKVGELMMVTQFSQKVKTNDLLLIS